jgi:hypothetical protein
MAAVRFNSKLQCFDFGIPAGGCTGVCVCLILMMRRCVCIRCVMRRCVFDPHDAQVCVFDSHDAQVCVRSA